MTVELKSRRFRDLETAKRVKLAGETDNADSIGETKVLCQLSRSLSLFFYLFLFFFSFLGF